MSSQTTRFGLLARHKRGIPHHRPRPGGDSSVWDLAAPSRLAIVLGAEGHGLEDRPDAAATNRVRIPISADVDSINVGHGAAIGFAVT